GELFQQPAEQLAVARRWRLSVSRCRIHVRRASAPADQKTRQETDPGGNAHGLYGIFANAAFHRFLELLGLLDALLVIRSGRFFGDRAQLANILSNARRFLAELVSH